MKKLSEYAKVLELELERILAYWKDVVPDQINGGFLGQVDNFNIPNFQAAKGVVLHARILWSFSAGYNYSARGEWMEQADRAYDYLVTHFLDREYGGVYWTVDYRGTPLDTKKQVYAVAFAIYGLSEYFMASGKQEAKDIAIGLFQDLLEHSYDKQAGGFFEAFNREWREMADLRLSDKDANEKKTMNTHLHILEAFANLYRIWPDVELKGHIGLLLSNFSTHIIDKNSGHLVLFFDEHWNRRSEIVSYGHDIEASWLLLEAAEVIGDEHLVSEFKILSLKMARAAAGGMDKFGGMYYELDTPRGHLNTEKHWWVQAEAMVGFFNAWQLKSDEEFLSLSLGCWIFAERKILDKKYGEWFWGIDGQGELMENQDKAGLWKCPYHNSRACLELIRRIDQGKAAFKTEINYE